MKKIINILTFIYIIVLYHLTKNSNTFLLTFSFSLFLIYYSIFSSNKIKKLLNDYYDKKYLYTMNKVFKCSILLIIILTMLLGAISYIISTLINIEKLYLVNIIMTIFLSISLIIKLINNYLNIFGYKKNILLNIYKLSSILFNIINIFLLYKVFLLEDYLKIIIIYLVPIILGIILIILSYILVVKKNNKYTKKREETKINYIIQIKKSLIDNRCIIIYNIINASYIYISIIVLYYILLNRYKYSYDDVSNYITNTYFYGIIIIYIIHLIIKKIYNTDINKLKTSIINKDNNYKDLFHKILNKIINTSLTITIILMIISGPINITLFNNDYNFIFGLVPLIFFYTIYDSIVNINIICNKEKNIIIFLLISLITKIIFEVPLINSAYRMGYTAYFGSIASTILGLIISIIIGIILLTRKLKINLLDNFNSILNIIYENIILCLILTLFTLIIKVDTKNIISSILVIIFYIFITIIYYITKRIIIPKNNQ